MTNDRRLRCTRCGVAAELEVVDRRLERVHCSLCGDASRHDEVKRILYEEASYTANK